jgi:hypothetical protein
MCSHPTLVAAAHRGWLSHASKRVTMLAAEELTAPNEGCFQPLEARPDFDPLHIGASRYSLPH